MLIPSSRGSLWEAAAATAELFGNLPDGPIASGSKVKGQARMREPVRDQIELRAVDLDSLIGQDDPARLFWDYLQKLDLRALEDAIKARDHTPGQAPPSPRLLLALWLYAVSQGVGGARALAKLCERHDSYRWLLGGVSVNYHTLSDFRTAHPQLLDRLLIEHVAAMSAAGIIDLDEVTQDGRRARAAAGAGSFRREKTLQGELEKATGLIEELKQESGSDASNRRIRAARERAARERKERVEAALAKQKELAAERERRSKANKAEVAKQKEPRASTADAEARTMKMADGGFRPAYNCQISTAAGGQVVIAVDLDMTGSDRGLLRPMLDELQRCYGRRPSRHLVDGGFNKNDDTEWAASIGADIYGPPMMSKHKTDPYAPRPDDSPGVAAWRERMGSPQGKEIYQRRCWRECINARFRQWGLYQFAVRGSRNVTTVLRWRALANNILADNRLKRAAA